MNNKGSGHTPFWRIIVRAIQQRHDIDSSAENTGTISASGCEQIQPPGGAIRYGTQVKDKTRSIGTPELEGLVIKAERISKDKSHSICTPELYRFMVECNKQLMEKDGVSESDLVTPPSIIDCDEMSGHDFESFCADLLQVHGYNRVKVTNGSGDQGIDILADKDDMSYGFQCKRYSSNVGNKAIQEAYSGRCYYNCDVAVVLTNQYFTDSACDLAKRTGVLLWNRDKLEELIITSGGLPTNVRRNKKQYSPNLENESDYNLFCDSSDDTMLLCAIDIVVETGIASVSSLQRKLKLGYSRAARLVDQMEELGVVGPFEGSKPRKVSLTKEQWKAMTVSNGQLAYK